MVFLPVDGPFSICRMRGRRELPEERIAAPEEAPAGRELPEERIAATATLRLGTARRARFLTLGSMRRLVRLMSRAGSDSLSSLRY